MYLVLICTYRLVAVFDVTFLRVLVLYRVRLVFLSPRGEVLVLSYDNLDSVPSQSPGVTEVLAEDWNTYVRDNFDTLKRGHVRVANEAALSGLTVAIGTMVFAESEESLWVRTAGSGDLSGFKEIAKLGNVGAVSDAASPFLAPVGAMNAYAGSSAPSGWLLCNGAAVSRSTYSALFSVVSTAYGAGDGSTTFNVPDLRGRVPFGLNSANSDVDDLSDNDGIVTLANRRPRHAHSASTSVAAHDLNHGHGASVSDPGHAHAIGARPNSTSGATYNAATTASNLGDNGNVVRAATTGISVTVNSTGTWTVGHSASTSVGPGAPGAGGTPTDTVPYIVVNYLIKA